MIALAPGAVVLVVDAFRRRREGVPRTAAAVPGSAT
jgi:hypothetical protein